jgi:hypothetical protein
VWRPEIPEHVPPEPDAAPALDPAVTGASRSVIVEGLRAGVNCAMLIAPLCGEHEMSESVLVPIEAEDEDLGPRVLKMRLQGLTAAQIGKGTDDRDARGAQGARHRFADG